MPETPANESSGAPPQDAAAETLAAPSVGELEGPRTAESVTGWLREILASIGRDETAVIYEPADQVWTMLHPSGRDRRTLVNLESIAEDWRWDFLKGSIPKTLTAYLEGDVPEAAGAPAPTRERFPRLDWTALFEDEVDEEEEWIVPQIFPARRISSVISEPKMGKSLFLLETAVLVAMGGDALGRVFGFNVSRPRRVLYVDFENDPRGDIRSRLEAMNYGPSDLDNLYYLSFPEFGPLDTPRGAMDLLECVKEYEAEVVIIDTVSRVVQGAENDNDTWLNFYRNVGLPLKQMEVACIRLDHTGKDASKGARGGSSKAGDVDLAWMLERSVGKDAYKLTAAYKRLRLTSDVIHLRRCEEPFLHHILDPDHHATVFQARADDLVAILEKFDIPIEWGRDRVRSKIREHDPDFKVTNENLSAAMAARREMAERAQFAALSEGASGQVRTGEVA